LFGIITLLGSGLFTGPAADAAPPRPNIVVILSDDMGFSDIGCYGGEIETPALDQLAAGGLRFTQFYNTARCCPTRASLLTGLYPHQAGVGHMVDDKGLPGYRGDLNDSCLTIAEALAPAGYASYAVGKWHVTKGVIPRSDADKHNWPMHARERDIEKYKGRYATGYEAVRAARYAKMLDLGVATAANTTLWPFPADLGERGEPWPWDERNMEVYAAMVDCMDRGIGQIVKALEESGQLDNTLICYLQDNGGCAEAMGRAGMGPRRAEAPSLSPLADTDIRTTLRPKQTRDGYTVRQGKGVMAGPADTFIGYGEAWSTVSNTPFRKHKHWVHEGGIATPLVVHWPRGINRPGRLDHTPGHLIDLMATCLDLAGAAYPATRRRPRAAAWHRCSGTARSTARPFSGSTKATVPFGWATGNSWRCTASRGNSTTCPAIAPSSMT
jgi:arylsulfatase A-like enzyme